MQVSEKTEVRVDTYYGQNGVTILVNRSFERCYKRTNNERTVVSDQNPHLVPHDNRWKFKRANLAVTRATHNFSVIRITNIWMQQQFQVY